MKIPSSIRPLKNAHRCPGESGMVTALFIALLAIMMVLIMVESSAVIRLHREVKMLEQQQLKRLNAPPANPVPLAPQP
jgi:hypothetical protein